MNKLFVIPLFACLSLLSCKKNTPINQDENVILENRSEENLKLSFAKTISKAIVNNKELRSFMKDEALSRKDNDFNVIYAFCKDKIINNKSFKNILIDYEEYDGLINDVERIIPTISILVPNLNEDFNPNNWDINNDNIFIATENTGKIKIIYSGEQVTELHKDEIPKTPTLFIKVNERIKVKQLLLKSSSLNESLIEFIHPSYNGLLSTKSRTGTTTGTSTFLTNLFDFEVSQKTVDAFKEFPTAGGGWQRDFLYYNLKNLPDAKGVLDRNYYETISAIKISESGLKLMMDQDDPTYSTTDAWDSENNRGRASTGLNVPKFWTDGEFELQIDVLINDISGPGAVFSNILSVPADQLFGAEFSFSRTITDGGRGAGTITYQTNKLTRLIPKFFYCNIPIKEWDLEKMGASWKISVRENDDNTVITSTETVSSKVATNFGFEPGFGDKVKLGLKFGISMEETKTQSLATQRTLTNDFLGDAIVNFWDPIIRVNTPVPGSNSNFLVDLTSVDRRNFAESYINVIEPEYLPRGYQPVYYQEQQTVKANSKNRYELSSFNSIKNNNFEIIMLPTYKF